MKQVAQQSIGSALLCGSSWRSAWLALFIVINSKLVPRAEPAVTAEAEAHYALIESLDW